MEYSDRLLQSLRVNGAAREEFATTFLTFLTGCFQRWQSSRPSLTATSIEELQHTQPRVLIPAPNGGTRSSSLSPLDANSSRQQSNRIGNDAFQHTGQGVILATAPEMPTITNPTPAFTQAPISMFYPSAPGNRTDLGWDSLHPPPHYPTAPTITSVNQQEPAEASWYRSFNAPIQQDTWASPLPSRPLAPLSPPSNMPTYMAQDWSVGPQTFTHNQNSFLNQHVPLTEALESCGISGTDSGYSTAARVERMNSRRDSAEQRELGANEP